jgi:hypothetical protein
MFVANSGHNSSELATLIQHIYLGNLSLVLTFLLS